MLVLFGDRKTRVIRRLTIWCKLQLTRRTFLKISSCKALKDKDHYVDDERHNLHDNCDTL